MDDAKKSVTTTIGHQLLVGALAATAAVGASNAVAADDIFFKLGDIKGESQDDKHKAEIDVLSWSWGVNGPAADAKGKLQPACSEPLTLQKRVDKTSPPMAAAAVLNTAISPARLTVRRPGKDPQEYFVVDFPTVTVKSLGQSMVLGDSVISETATLGFTSATITYKAQLSDGSLGAEVTATVPASCP